MHKDEYKTEKNAFFTDKLQIQAYHKKEKVNIKQTLVQ